jgi:hypothetical protein
MDLNRLWIVEATPVGCARWLVIADNEDDAEDAGEELESDITFRYDAYRPTIQDGKLLAYTDMRAEDEVIVADCEKDKEITLQELQLLIAEQHEQFLREERVRNNRQLLLPID